MKVTSPCTSTSRASLKVISCNWAYFLHFRGPEEGQVARAKVLTEDLLLVVRSEHAKAQAIVHQQQMELHQAQAQYAAYSAMAVGLLSPLPRSHLFCPSGIMVHELLFFVLFDLFTHLSHFLNAIRIGELVCETNYHRLAHVALGIRTASRKRSTSTTAGRATSATPRRNATTTSRRSSPTWDRPGQ